MLAFDNNDKTERSITSFKVSNLNNTFELNVESLLIANTLSTENEIPPNPDDLKKFEHLKNLKINTLENNSIEVLLDAKYAYYFRIKFEFSFEFGMSVHGHFIKIYCSKQICCWLSA